MSITAVVHQIRAALVRSLCGWNIITSCFFGFFGLVPIKVSQKSYSITVYVLVCGRFSHAAAEQCSRGQHTHSFQNLAWKTSTEPQSPVATSEIRCRADCKRDIFSWHQRLVSLTLRWQNEIRTLTAHCEILGNKMMTHKHLHLIIHHISLTCSSSSHLSFRLHRRPRLKQRFNIFWILICVTAQGKCL